MRSLRLGLPAGGKRKGQPGNSCQSEEELSLKLKVPCWESPLKIRHVLLLLNGPVQGMGKGMAKNNELKESGRRLLNEICR